MPQYDRIEGGIATMFLDGPKKDQTGIVTPSVHGEPPERLHFGEGNHTIYLRQRGTVTVTANDPISGKRRRLKGVPYKLDPQCHMAAEVRAFMAGEHARRGETGVLS